MVSGCRWQGQFRAQDASGQPWCWQVASFLAESVSAARRMRRPYMRFAQTFSPLSPANSGRSPCGIARCLSVGVPVEHGHEAVGECEQETLQPIGLAVHHDREDHQHGEDHYGQPGRSEVQVKGLADHPACQHRKWHHEHRYLRARPNSDGDRGAHLRVVGHPHCGGVLAGVAHYRQQNDADERPRNTPRNDHAINRIDHNFRQSGYSHRADQQQTQSPGDTQYAILNLWAVIVVGQQNAGCQRH
mmetsp:Transcript_66871/g.189731  ORF Transcript_66871/g.189731 Transcript_66871/m.189731 type:complete len:245 (-) Transcript_66871:1112-1846(-)